MTHSLSGPCCGETIERCECLPLKLSRYRNTPITPSAAAACSTNCHDSVIAPIFSDTSTQTLSQREVKMSALQVIAETEFYSGSGRRVRRCVCFCVRFEWCHIFRVAERRINDGKLVAGNGVTQNTYRHSFPVATTVS